jgi:hypothetical protein
VLVNCNQLGAPTAFSPAVRRSIDNGSAGPSSTFHCGLRSPPGQPGGFKGKFAKTGVPDRTYDPIDKDAFFLGTWETTAAAALMRHRHHRT